MYATRDDLITRFGETEILELEGVQGVDKTDKALADATKLMNTRIRSRYRLPLPSIPEELELQCSNIARYLMYANELLKEVSLRYQEAIDWLKDLSKGNVVLTFEADPAIDESQSTIARAVAVGDTYKGKVFGDDVFAQMVGGFLERQARSKRC